MAATEVPSHIVRRPVFNGFFEEIGTVADGAVTGMTTAGGSVGGPVAVVAVMAVVAVVAVVAMVALVTVLAVVAGNAAGGTAL